MPAEDETRFAQVIVAQVFVEAVALTFVGARGQ
jgi:hypothetical protein